MSGEQSKTTTERGPNGIPFADNDRTGIGQWESGVYKIEVGREDGEFLRANLREEQLKALRQSIEYALENGVDSQ
jgi:hypothetical protein